MSFTAEQRSALEAELTARGAYAHAVSVHGPEHFLTKLRRGWSVKKWTGALEYSGIKRDAIAMVRGEARRCQERASEIRAQLEAAAWDAERATVSPEERLAAATAERDAMAPRGFAPRGHSARKPLRIDPLRAAWSRRRRIA